MAQHTNGAWALVEGGTDIHPLGQSIVAVSNSFQVQSSSIAFTIVPSSGSIGTSLSVAGVVTPSNAIVEVGFSKSPIIPPTNFVSASSVSGNWSASVTPQAIGTTYLWAQQTNASNVLVISSPIIIAGVILTVSAPASAIIDSAVAITGTVTSSNAMVTVQFSAENTIEPASAGTSATVTGSSFAATLTPTNAGTFYVWAQDQSADTSAVSKAVFVTTQLSTNYIVTQPANTNYTHGTGTIAINGSISPAQNTATQAALSTNNTTPPSLGWQPASVIDNNTLWALYLTTPTQPGAYYVWVETTDGVGTAVSAFTLNIT